MVGHNDGLEHLDPRASDGNIDAVVKRALRIRTIALRAMQQALYERRRRQQAIGKVRQADKNGDGSISKEELKSIFRKLDKWTDEEFDVLWTGADKNGDDKLQYEEFLDWAFHGGLSSIITGILFDDCS